MECKTTNTIWAKIFIAGPLHIIEDVCREKCFEGLCVTVTPTKYIYTGGEETGVIIGLINYPRFPSDYSIIKGRAVAIADAIMERAYQTSYTIMMPDETIWINRRDELSK